MYEIILVPQLKPKTLDAWNWRFKFNFGSTALL